MLLSLSPSLSFQLFSKKSAQLCISTLLPSSPSPAHSHWSVSTWPNWLIHRWLSHFSGWFWDFSLNPCLPVLCVWFIWIWFASAWDLPEITDPQCWICEFIVFITFRKISNVGFSNIFSVPPPLLLQLIIHMFGHLMSTDHCCCLDLYFTLLFLCFILNSIYRYILKIH